MYKEHVESRLAFVGYFWHSTHYAGHFTSIISVKTHNDTILYYQVGTIITPIAQMRKLRH